MTKPLHPASVGLSRLGLGLLVGVLLLACLLTLLPFWVMLVLSLSPAGAVIAEGKASLWVWPPTTENYAFLVQAVPLLRYLGNSVLVAVTSTIGHVLLCAMAGYAVSQRHWRWANATFFMAFLTLLIPPQVNLVPLFFLMKTLGWMNTLWALIVPSLFGAFGVFLYRQWFKALPVEVDEAAMLDGCNPWQRFWYVALPMVTPATATLAVLVFIGSWNSFLWPLIVTHSEELRTLPLGLAALKQSFRDTTNWAVLMAAATLTVLPTVLVYAFGQRYLFAGLSSGGGKE
jgi:multiple sugar transport system permease protein